MAKYSDVAGGTAKFCIEHSRNGERGSRAKKNDVWREVHGQDEDLSTVKKRKRAKTGGTDLSSTRESL